MTTTFPRSSPSALGIRAEGIGHLLDALEATPGVEPHSIMVLRHGRLAAEGWWAPYAADRPHSLYSLSKSFTAAAVGIAVREGLVDLDRTVLSYFPELDDAVTDERSRRMLVRHIAAMASGHRTDTISRAEQIDPDDIVRGFLTIPPDEEPGTVFAYNQPCTYTLGAIVRRVSGGSLLDYLRPRLFAPLGIDDFAWRRDATGAELGFSGGYTVTASIAALGQLYLQRGEWGGERILDEGWVAQATTAHVANPDEDNPDWRQGYGFQFWMARHGFRGDGAYGQFCLVLPEQDVVVAMTGQSADMQAVLDAVWEHLLPAIDASTDGAADDALAARLAALALPPVDGTPLDAADAGRFAPGAANAVDGLEAVELRRDPSGGWAVTLVDRSGTIGGPVGSGAWATSEGVSASGAVDGAGVVLLDVRLVETPHMLRIRCDPGATTFDASWVTEPLHDGLTELHRPAD